MTGTIIHIPTGRLIHENESAAFDEKKANAEKSVLDIVAPDGRNIFSIRKLIEAVSNQNERQHVAA